MIFVIFEFLSLMQRIRILFDEPTDISRKVSWNIASGYKKR